MERLTLDNFILDEIVEEVGQTEEGYVYIIDKSNDKSRIKFFRRIDLRRPKGLESVINLAEILA